MVTPAVFACSIKIAVLVKWSTAIAYIYGVFAYLYRPIVG